MQDHRMRQAGNAAILKPHKPALAAFYSVPNSPAGQMYLLGFFFCPDGDVSNWRQNSVTLRIACKSDCGKYLGKIPLFARVPRYLVCNRTQVSPLTLGILLII